MIIEPDAALVRVVGHDLRGRKQRRRNVGQGVELQYVSGDRVNQRIGDLIVGEWLAGQEVDQRCGLSRKVADALAGRGHGGDSGDALAVAEAFVVAEEEKLV